MAGEGIDEVALEHRLGSIEGKVDRLGDHLARIDRHLATQNGRLDKGEGRLAELEHARLAQERYRRGYDDGRGSLGAVDLGKIVGLMTVVLGVAIAALRALEAAG